MFTPQIEEYLPSYGTGRADYSTETGENEFEHAFVSGVVAVREGPRGNVYTLQCAKCSALEEPLFLCLMQTHFHSRSPVNDNPRLCRPCRVERYAGCDCHTCVEDRAELSKVGAA